MEIHDQKKTDSENKQRTSAPSDGKQEKDLETGQKESTYNKTDGESSKDGDSDFFINGK